MLPDKVSSAGRRGYRASRAGSYSTEREIDKERKRNIERHSEVEKEILLPDCSADRRCYRASRAGTYSIERESDKERKAEREIENETHIMRKRSCYRTK